MKTIYRAIDNFCHKHYNFGIPRLMIWLAGGSIIVFFVNMIDPSGAFINSLTFSPARILQGQVWRLISWVFIPIDFNPIWFALSLYFYYVFGTSLERAWGTCKLTLYFFAGVLLYVLLGLIIQFIQPGRYSYVWSTTTTANIGLTMFLAYATMNPHGRILLLFIIPVKMWWLAAFDLAMLIFQIAASPFPVNLQPLVLIAVYLVFCWEDLVEVVKSLLPSARRNAKFHDEVHHAEQSAGFSKAVKNSESFSERKCSVCGKKAAEHPELEFRYCSRCAGMHCFCEEHINSHVHFSE